MNSYPVVDDTGSVELCPVDKLARDIILHSINSKPAAFSLVEEIRRNFAIEKKFSVESKREELKCFNHLNPSGIVSYNSVFKQMDLFLQSKNQEKLKPLSLEEWRTLISKEDNVLNSLRGMLPKAVQKASVSLKGYSDNTEDVPITADILTPFISYLYDSYIQK